MKKVALAGVLMIAVLIFTGCGNKDSQSQKPTAAPSDQKPQTGIAIDQGDPVFFWGAGCPHCENVEKFLKDNGGLEEKLKLKKIEVFNNPNGQKLFLEKIKECGLSTPGVPVFYKGGKCAQGDQPIIDELKKLTTDDK